MSLSTLSSNPSSFVHADPLPQWNQADPGYHWPDSAVIHDMHNSQKPDGTEKIDLPRPRVIHLLQQEFGTAYRLFTEEIRSDEEILMLAAVQSGGHNLKYAPAGVIENLSVEWWLEAARRGVQGWVLTLAPEHIRDHDEVVHACVGNCGDAIGYASERLRRDPTTQRIAVTNNPIAIDRCIDPPDDLVSSVKKISAIRSPSEHI